MSNPLVELQHFGQSVWYDNISRGLIMSGELKRLIEADGILGLTSNPAIFEKAISGSEDYAGALRALAVSGRSTLEIYEQIAVEDIQRAADLLLPVYEASAGGDGFVSALRVGVATAASSPPVTSPGGETVGFGVGGVRIPKSKGDAPITGFHLTVPCGVWRAV